MEITKIEETIIYTEQEQSIMNMVAEQLGVDIEKVSYRSDFEDDLGADSLDRVELIMALEELLDCDISDETAERMKTVKDVFDYFEPVN